MPHTRNERALTSQAAMRIKSAEFWLKLGHTGEALLELQRLPRRLWSHRSVKMMLQSFCGVRH